jgi:hypothetical protein
VALRRQLWLGLPLSQDQVCSDWQSCQFGKILKTVRFESVAVIDAHSSLLSGFGRSADIQPGRTSFVVDAERSDALRKPDLNGS